MASVRAPGGFSIYQLLTRVIPGLLIVTVGISIISIEHAVQILSQNENGNFDQIILDLIEIVVAYYLWVPILVGAIIVGEFVDLIRKSLFPVPKKFRRYLYYNSGDGVDKSVLTFSQYMSVWFEEKYNNPEQKSDFRVYIRHPHFWILLLISYISVWLLVVTDGFMKALWFFVVSLVITFPIFLFRDEFRNIRFLTHNPIFRYIKQSPENYFDLESSNTTLQNIRSDCGFDEDLNDPSDLYFGLNMLVDGSSSTNTTDLRMIYQFNKNIYVSLYICAFFLFIAAVFGTVFQQLFVFLFVMVIFPFVLLYRSISSVLEIEEKFVKSLLLEYHILNQESK